MKHILVVDDDPAVSGAIREILQPEGFEIECPPEPRSALMDALRRVPDLVILDVNMPAMTGWEFCAILRRQSATREVPVLFLTGRAEVKDRITAMQLGGSDFLAKPFGAADLRRKVRSLVSESHAVEEG